jgi:hypothetical protein
MIKYLHVIVFCYVCCWRNIKSVCCKRFKKFPEFVSDKIIDSSPILSELLGWDRPDIQFELSLILQDVVCRRFYDAGADGLKKGFTIVVVNLELNELLEMILCHEAQTSGVIHPSE